MPGRSSHFIVAASATLISVCALFVSVYQTNLMHKQQEMSVWPHLEWLPSFGDDIGWYLELENKGVGPAIIQDLRIELEGKEIKQVDLVKIFLGEDQLFYLSTVEKRVVAPGEKIRFLGIPASEEEATFKMDSMFRSSTLNIEIDYCSVYEKCWTTNGLSVKPLNH